METNSYPCYHCKKNLIGHPKIGIDIHSNGKFEAFCFFCAKKNIAKMAPSVEVEFKRLHKLFFDLKNQYQKKFQDYCKLREDFSNEGTYIYWITVVGLPILIGFIFNKIAGFIALPILWIYLTRERNLRIIEFDNTNPQQSSFTLKEPTLPSLWATIHHPIRWDWEEDNYLPDLPDEPKSYYRPIILQRDQYTCQKCGQIKPKGKLEVHHIITRKYNGDDAPTNLVTLCLKCHDLETWYGHVRIHPREIDPPEGYCELGTYEPKDDSEATTLCISELRKLEMHPNLIPLDSKPITSEEMLIYQEYPTEQKQINTAPKQLSEPEEANGLVWVIAVLIVLFIFFRSCNEGTRNSTQTNSISSTVQTVHTTTPNFTKPQENTSVDKTVQTNAEKPIQHHNQQNKNISPKESKVELVNKGQKNNKANNRKKSKSDIRNCLQLQDNQAITRCTESYH